MAVLPDNVFLAYQQIETLLKANTSFTTGGVTPLVKPGNFISVDSAVPFPKKTNRNTSDFPELTLEVAASTDSGFSATKTFANSGPGALNTDPATIRRTQTYKITIIGQDQRLQPVSAIVSAVEADLTNATARLGLPNIIGGWGPIAGNYSYYTEAGATKQQRKWEGTFPVIFVFQNTSIPNSST